MSKETKFGYGFLLVGTGVPYLIEKAVGLSYAILISVAFVIIGSALLLAGHRHKDNPPPRKLWSWLAIAACLSTLVILSWLGILRTLPKSEPQLSSSAQPTSQEVKKEIPPVTPAPTPIAPKRQQDHPKSSPPFAVQIETVILNAHPKQASLFWVIYKNEGVRTASPARIALYMRFTNLQEHVAMISKYAVKWGKIQLIKISGPPTEMFYSYDGNLHHACWINNEDILDKKLMGLNLEPRLPVQGLALFDYPAELMPESVSESDFKIDFTVTITDVEGVAFTSGPIKTEPDHANESVQSRILEFNRGSRDLSNFKIVDFRVPRGFIESPF